jgi:hypothetical protein
MKKAVVFVVLAMVLIGSSAAQSAINDAQRLVGTWASLDNGIIYVFNANGTGTSSGRRAQSENGNIFWGVSSSGELYVILASSNTITNGICYFSSDGRRMIFLDSVYQKR